MIGFKGKIINSIEISTLLKLLKSWKRKNDLSIDSGIIDIVVYAITHKYTLVNLNRNLI